MNSLLIKKLIKTNNETYPEFTYSNPLLDKNVTKALSRSFVKILSTCKENTNVNNNIRSLILENIRRLCMIHPENHVEVEENLTDLLSKFYENHIKDTKFNNSDIEKKLDIFLIETHKELAFNSTLKSNINPEIVQSLLNLNVDSMNRNTSLQSIYEDVMFWDTDQNFSIILKDLWANYESIDLNILNNLSLKVKPQIENILLETSIKVVDNIDCNWQDIFMCNKEYNVLINISSISTNCFQICCSILNCIFINTYFNEQIQRLVNEYINKVKLICIDGNFSLLYPYHLISIVSLLDIDLEELPNSIKVTYVDSTLKHLKNVHLECEADLIMLLSHFPNWFDLYFT